MPENFGFILFGLVIVGLFIVRPVFGLWRDRREHRASEASADRAEAFFRASFPELLPHFHPSRVGEYVAARVHQRFPPTYGWTKPAGFDQAAVAVLSPDPKGERTILIDADGKELAEFVLEPREGALGVIRVGAGKLTVRQSPRQPPRVKYWHPDREFEWRGRGRWKFNSRVADETIDTTDRNWSSSSSSSSWSPTTTTAAAAGVVGLGGTFDGGGASAGWDAPEGGNPSDGSGAGPGDSSFASVSSGSSSTADSSGSSSDSADSSGFSSGTSY